MEESPFSDSNFLNRSNSPSSTTGSSSNPIDLVLSGFKHGLDSDLTNLPSIYMFIAGLIYYAGVIAIFVWIFRDNYISTISTRYLSYGNQSADLCLEVLQSNTGTFLADIDGNWEVTTYYLL